MSEGETWRETGAEQEGREKVWGRSGESQRRSGRRFDLKMKCQFSSCPSNLHPKHRRWPVTFPYHFSSQLCDSDCWTEN